MNALLWKSCGKPLMRKIPQMGRRVRGHPSPNSASTEVWTGQNEKLPRRAGKYSVYCVAGWVIWGNLG